MDREGSIEYTVNLQQFETTSDIAQIQYYAGNRLTPTDVRTQGYTVENGRILPNGRHSQRFFFAQNSNNGTWSAGFGDPAANSKVGFGGGIPLVINGLPFGNEKKIDAAGRLVQQSNAGYPKQNRANVGKTIIAFKNGGDFLIVAQEDGTDGMTLDEIRAILITQGYKNALSFDGSNSATLVREKYIINRPHSRKDNSIPIGATFTIYDED